MASIETANRLAVKVVEDKLKRGITSYLAQDKFTVVTVDNVDILQPYAFVSTLNATRSWHGTSVQCIQPLPHSGNLTELDFHDHSATESNSIRTATHSADSPLPELKKSIGRGRSLSTLHTPLLFPVNSAQVRPYLSLKPSYQYMSPLLIQVYPWRILDLVWRRRKA